VREKEIIEDEALLSSLLEIDKRVKGIGYVKYRSVYADAGKATSYFVNSDGTRIGAELPYVSAFAAMTVSAGGDSRQRMLQFGGTGGLELFDPGAICERLESEAGALRNVIKTGKTLAKAELAGITNVVVSPEIIGIAVHESIGHPSEADRVFGREAAQAGTSYLGPGELGIEIGSEKVTIADDPTIKGSYGFYLYDDEGVKARKKVIVRGGKQDALLVNREYANDLKIRSNSSARSDMYSNEPLVRMSNTYLERGELGLEELVEVAKEGIYIKSFTEWNIDDTRSFARYQGNEAYLIRNGRISTPVKNYALEAKTLDFWHAVRELGSDFELTLGECGKGEPVQGVPVTMGGPHALLCFG
jgi:TldD protein